MRTSEGSTYSSLRSVAAGELNHPSQSNAHQPVDTRALAVSGRRHLAQVCAAGPLLGRAVDGDNTQADVGKGARAHVIASHPSLHIQLFDEIIRKQRICGSWCA